MQGGEEEEEKPKPSVGRAALAAARAVGICHPSPGPETPVWVFWWCRRDGPVPNRQDARGLILSILPLSQQKDGKP